MAEQFQFTLNDENPDVVAKLKFEEGVAQLDFEISGIDMRTGMSYTSALGFGCDQKDLQAFSAWLVCRIRDNMKLEKND